MYMQVDIMERPNQAPDVRFSFSCSRVKPPVRKAEMLAIIEQMRSLIDASENPE
jgi:hypothetical protein